MIELRLIQDGPSQLLCSATIEINKILIHACAKTFFLRTYILYYKTPLSYLIQLESPTAP